MDTLFSIASFLVSSSHETFVEENRWFGGGVSQNQSTLGRNKVQRQASVDPKFVELTAEVFIRILW